MQTAAEDPHRDQADLPGRQTQIPTEGWSHVEQQLNKQFEERRAGQDDEEGRGRARAASSTRSSARWARRWSARSGRSAERALAQAVGPPAIKPDEEITYDQMMVYYRQHQDEFTTPARAQWEELMVSFSKYPDKAAAYDAIARMGNQVLGGAPFAEVAKAGSDGVTAADGGRRDWTTKGALVCQELDRALFSLARRTTQPDHREAHRLPHHSRHRARGTVVKPFLEAQVDIEKKIMQAAFGEAISRVPGETGGPNARLDDLRRRGRQSQLATPPHSNPSGGELP